MKRIIFRVNAGQGAGVGHLVRCCSLARELKELGHECYFLLSYFDAGVLPFLDGLEYGYLFNHDQTPTERVSHSVELDARSTLQFLANKQVDWLILDDYLLGKEWEEIFFGQGTQLLVIDDLCREHVCDVLLDIRWRGDISNSAYDKLVPAQAVKLIGPQYALLDSQYRQPPQEQKRESFTVLIGVGGGGDNRVNSDIISALLQLTNTIDIIIKPILGPLTENKQLLDIFQGNNQIQPITDCFDLYPHLMECDLYIGAAGGVLYQLLALNKPALTFSLASNQQTPLADLEGIGHYFHCDESFDIGLLAPLILTIYEHYERVKVLPSKAINIDGLGASRVANFLLNSTAPKLAEFISPVQIKPESYENLNEHYRVRPVDDSDINHYLDSRNLSSNAQNMIESKPIARLGHYTWWFNTQRSSYLLEKDNQASLYIWHQIQDFKECQFLIGGWFVCQQNTSFQDALLALNWQLEHCDKYWPLIPWIAVIHKENRYVKLMNDYLGFNEVSEEHPYYAAIGSIFAGASIDEFYYVMREPKAKPLSQTTLS
ncbi:UDP-2,4-diacetamido-2,4,6-trideoxy-beta-L-altropyranose hydrolase [Shewanella sp. UCD-KL12]|uniref:UDP-2,4-diacetamido-2,4, 6-trideoxy-beta-L-altropyranose hydrolase n=1 Tax=Shewanella sp. UCD-KL12 TaxID=1917163 RepID=UPI000970BC6F|nr:UDP-2,4-diacetamido-2,4,6-trideoxy-beta-L-altropyranose hydrolase [Shewanella sp. UCD-KL12]